MPCRNDAVALEAAPGAAERAAVERDHRTAGLRLGHERGDVAADAGNAGHLGRAVSMEQDGDPVGELARARARVLSTLGVFPHEDFTSRDGAIDPRNP